MAPNFQSSFIPKEPITEEVFKKKKAGPLGVLAVSLFIFSIIASVGVYFYKGILRNDIQSLQAQLAQEEKNIDKETINEMFRFGQKLSVTKSIVVKHQLVSKLLDSLSSSTISSVQYTEFAYEDKESNLLLTLSGKATSYASVALQENIFAQNEYFKSVLFSNLSLVEKGLVSFDLLISVDPKIVLNPS